MKSAMKIICSLLIIIMVPSISMAVELVQIYGVKIHLENNKILDGYILTNAYFDACDGNDDKWNYYVEEENSLDGGKVIFIGKLVNVKQDDAPNLPAKSSNFPGKLVKIKRDDYWPEFLAAKSSVKKIEIDDIKSIKGVCSKWSGTSISAFSSVPEISDYMAEYIANHKMLAAYTFNAEDPQLSKEEYAYGLHTTYLSYNREYPRKRLIKERKIIDKMSDDVLNKNKLVRFTWADD